MALREEVGSGSRGVVLGARRTAQQGSWRRPAPDAGRRGFHCARFAFSLGSRKSTGASQADLDAGAVSPTASMCFGCDRLPAAKWSATIDCNRSSIMGGVEVRARLIIGSPSDFVQSPGVVGRRPTADAAS